MSRGRGVAALAKDRPRRIPSAGALALLLGAGLTLAQAPTSSQLEADLVGKVHLKKHQVDGSSDRHDYALATFDASGDERVLVPNIKRTLHEGREGPDPGLSSAPLWVQWDADYELAVQTERAAYLLANEWFGGDWTTRHLYVFDKKTRGLRKDSPVNEVFQGRGLLLQLREASQYVWIPFNWGGGAVRRIYKLDLVEESHLLLVDLPEDETLNGSDPCDRSFWVMDVALQRDTLRFAVYDNNGVRNRYLEFPGGHCAVQLDRDEQERIADPFLKEVRTLSLD